MSIKDRMNQDLKQAMKDKDVARRGVLRGLLAAIKQVEVDKQKDTDDKAVIDILMTEAKRRREAIENFEQGGRVDQAADERFELEVIESYLPQQITEAEIRAEVETVVAEIGATSSKDKGSVMKVLMPRVKGKADGKLVNEVVTTVLKEMEA